MTFKITAFDKNDVALFTIGGSKAARASVQAAANQKAINAQRVAHPSMYRIEITNSLGNIDCRLLVGAGRDLNAAVIRDGKLVPMFS